jgi:hypothetical protein
MHLQLNRVALVSGIAANRMAEFSLLPDEIERRRQSEKIFAPFSKKRRGTDALSYCSSNGIGSDQNRRKKLFQSTITQSLTNSESNLR